MRELDFVEDMGLDLKVFRFLFFLIWVIIKELFWCENIKVIWGIMVLFFLIWSISGLIKSNFIKDVSSLVMVF